MADQNDFATEAALIIASAASFDPEKHGQFAMVPEGYTIADLEGYQNWPNRTRANHRFVDIASLVAYLTIFGKPATMICADYGNRVIEAVIDGDLPDAPSHRQHRAAFHARFSDKLRAWLEVEKKALSQVEFGLFLEDRAVDVIKPDSADVMEMVMKFDATKKVAYKSSTRLHDGQRQFQYVEENETRGAVTLPDHFVILAPVFQGMEPQSIKFMVRYRIEDTSLRFIVQMHDKDAVLREAFDRCVDAVRFGWASEGHPIFVTG